MVSLKCNPDKKIRLKKLTPPDTKSRLCLDKYGFVRAVNLLTEASLTVSDFCIAESLDFLSVAMLPGSEIFFHHSNMANAISQLASILR